MQNYWKELTMPDITHCANGCYLKETCARFSAKPLKYASYADFTPDENGHCQWFVEKMKGLNYENICS